jgi:uncharacterized protein (DUF2062 family)
LVLHSQKDKLLVPASDIIVEFVKRWNRGERPARKAGGLNAELAVAGGAAAAADAAAMGGANKVVQLHLALLLVGQLALQGLAVHMLMPLTVPVRMSVQDQMRLMLCLRAREQIHVTNCS